MFTLIVLVAQTTCGLCHGSRWITCETCDGAYGRVERVMPCKREKGVGCDGEGWRECFRCKGAGTMKCQVCNGDGLVAVKVPRYQYRNGQTFTQYVKVDGACSRCNNGGRQGAIESGGQRGTGKEACSVCGKFEVCERCGRPRGDYPHPCVCSSDPPPKLKSKPGYIRCPRCKGVGERTIKGKCPDCEKGKVPCPRCVKP